MMNHLIFMQQPCLILNHQKTALNTVIPIVLRKLLGLLIRRACFLH
jgi:hypothetical protein